jgi:predicted RNase H-like HicB family nuclease
MAIDKHPYLIEVFWSEEDAAYIASVPDLPGCSAAGMTESLAIAQAHVAINLWIDASQKAGNPIPAPTAKPRQAA